ncbi:MAG: penicillin-binding protein 2 [Elusimicrobiota bacterium]|jgi:cell division protein FtsI (penicillin-binding protein 3)
MRIRRLWVASVLSLAAFVLIVTRLGYLQLYCHAALLQRANREHARQHVDDRLPRGAILDRSGVVLAMSIQGGACYADPRRVMRADETARLLSPILHIPSNVLLGKLTQKRRFVWLARRLDPETVQHLQNLHRPGISVAPEQKRFYPEDTLASQTIGVVGDEQEGLSGVELVVNGWLSGRSTPFLFKQWTLAKRPAHPLADPSDLTPRSIVLTLDRQLQTIVEQELAVQMQLSRPKSGTVIIEDPQTGEILAMATAPSFNPNQWGVPGSAQQESPELLSNPAVEKIIEPGSTFKIVTAAAALEERKVALHDNFFCENGSWQIPGRLIHDHEKEGWLTFTEVISHSSNIGTAKVAMRLGQTDLYRYARAFGFGMPSGCGLPGDGVGILRQPSQWRPSSLGTISFGQEVGVTPLQMVNAYCVIANGGTLLEPRLYKGFVDDDGTYQEWQANQPVRRVISTKTAQTMRQILQEVVANGTGKAAQVAGLPVAGKTGTAQKIDPLTRQYSSSRYLASFCGFAPAEHPRIVIGVFLDEPQNGYWGGSEAAPLFSRIMRNAASTLHFPNTHSGPLLISRTIIRM